MPAVVLRDVRLKSEAEGLRREVAALTAETQKLDARVASLRRHFAEMQADVQQIDITAQRIIAAGGRIEAVEPMAKAAE